MIKILKTGKLRINRFKFTNDPRESKDRNAAIIEVSYESNHFTGQKNNRQIRKGQFSFLSNSDRDNAILQISKIANEIALEEWKVFCVSMHRPKKSVTHILDEVYNHSVRYGYSRPRMWAQYAQNHTGVCIIFDAEKLNAIIHNHNKSSCKILQGRVSYNTKPLLFNTLSLKDLNSKIDLKILRDELRQHYILNFKELFLTKHPDWRDESEYRWILHSPRKSNLYIPIENSIKSILVGIDFPLAMERQLIEHCKSLGISVGRMEWDGGMALARFGSIYKP